MDFRGIRENVVRHLARKDRPAKDTVGDREVSDTVEAQTALILVNATPFAFKPGPRNYDRTWIRDGSSQALALLWAGLFEEAKNYVIWYSKRIYENGLAPPILNMDGTINRGYGSDIEFDAQGEFVGIAADVFASPGIAPSSTPFSNPWSGRPSSSGNSALEPMRMHGPKTRFHGLLAPSISHEGYSKPSYSYWDDFFALSALRNCEYLAREIGDMAVAADPKAKAQGVCRGSRPLHSADRRGVSGEASFPARPIVRTSIRLRRRSPSSHAGSRTSFHASFSRRPTTSPPTASS